MRFFIWNITVERNKKPRKPYKFGAKRWTAEDTQILLDLINDNKPIKDIAAHLKRTPQAVSQRLNKVRSA